MQGEGQQFKSAILHQPTDRRNLLKEETNFRHGIIYAEWPPMVRCEVGLLSSSNPMCLVSLPPNAYGSIATIDFRRKDESCPYGE